MENVAALFSQGREQPYHIDHGLIVCRTPESFTLHSRLRAINGFTMRDTWTEAQTITSS